VCLPLEITLKGMEFRYDRVISSVDMTYLLTAVRFAPSGSSTVHIYTQTVHRTTQVICVFISNQKGKQSIR
jgi:hypothetical protein